MSATEPGSRNIRLLGNSDLNGHGDGGQVTVALIRKDHAVRVDAFESGGHRRGGLCDPITVYHFERLGILRPGRRPHHLHVDGITHFRAGSVFRLTLSHGIAGNGDDQCHSGGGRTVYVHAHRPGQQGSDRNLPGACELCAVTTTGRVALLGR